MKRRASLTMMEQGVMLLVFALAAALCLKAFLWADTTAKENADRDLAVLCAQNAAQHFKLTGEEQTLHYDENWQQTARAAAYVLTVIRQQSAIPGLAQAEITVARADGERLFAIPTARQEVP